MFRASDVSVLPKTILSGKESSSSRFRVVALQKLCGDEYSTFYGLQKKLMGRLGNQFFQVASIIGLATKFCIRACITGGANEFLASLNLSILNSAGVILFDRNVAKIGMPTRTLTEHGKWGTWLEFNISKTERNEISWGG